MGHMEQNFSPLQMHFEFHTQNEYLLFFLQIVILQLYDKIFLTPLANVP